MAVFCVSLWVKIVAYSVLGLALLFAALSTTFAVLTKTFVLWYVGDAVHSLNGHCNLVCSVANCFRSNQD